jgi:hypothetical protein
MRDTKLRVRLDVTSEKWRAEPPISMVHNVKAAVEGVAEARQARVLPAMVRLVLLSVVVADSCTCLSRTTVVMFGLEAAAMKAAGVLTYAVVAWTESGGGLGLGGGGGVGGLGGRGGG